MKGTTGEGAARIGGWFKNATASLEGHVKEIRENSKLIASEVQDSVKIDLEKAGRRLTETWEKASVLGPGYKEERFDVTFKERALGLELDLGAGLVKSVKPGGQAESLGVLAQDRLVALDGEALPPAEDPKFQEAAKLKLSKISRPVCMSFVRVVRIERGKAEAPAAAQAGLQAASEEEVQLLQTKLQACEAELADARQQAATAEEEAEAVKAEIQLTQAWAKQEAQRHLAEASMGQDGQAERLQAAESALKEREASLAAEGDERTSILQASLVTEQEQRAELQRSHDSLVASQRDLQERLHKTESNLSSFSAGSEEVQRRIAESEAALVEERRRVQQSQNAQTETSASCEDALQKLQQAERLKTDLSARLQAAEAALKEREASLAAEGDERANGLQASLVAEQERRVELQRSHDSLVASQRDLQERLHKAESNLSSFLAESEAALVEERRRVQQSQNAQTETSASCEDALQKLQEAERLKTDLSSRLHAAEQALKEREASLAAEGDERTGILQASLVTEQDRANGLQAALVAEREQRAELQRARDGSEASLRDFQERLRKAEGHLSIILAEREEVQRRIDESEAALAGERRKVEKAKAEFAETSTSRDEALQNLLEANKLKAGLETRIATAEQVLEERQASLASDFHERAQKLQASLAAEQERSAELQSSHDDLDVARQLLHGELHESKAAHCQLQELLAQAMKDLAAGADLQVRVRELEEEQQSFDSALAVDSTLAAERARSAQLQKAADELHALRRSQEEQIREVSAERDALKEELLKAEADLRQASLAAVDQVATLRPTLVGKASSSALLPVACDEEEEASSEQQQLLPSEGLELVPPKALQDKLEDLEAQNAALKRRLDSRPIVYQFAEPDAGVEDPEAGVLGAEDEDGDFDFNHPPAEAVSGLLALRGAALSCRRATRGVARSMVKCAVKCRRQPLVWSLDQQLRWLTRLLLKRPLLMWLFYVQLLALWFTEAYRQAASAPLPTDPSSRLEVAMKVATAAAQHGKK